MGFQKEEEESSPAGFPLFFRGGRARGGWLGLGVSAGGERRRCGAVIGCDGRVLAGRGESSGDDGCFMFYAV